MRQINWPAKMKWSAKRRPLDRRGWVSKPGPRRRHRFRIFLLTAYLRCRSGSFFCDLRSQTTRGRWSHARSHPACCLRATPRFGIASLGPWNLDLEVLGFDWVRQPDGPRPKVTYSQEAVGLFDRAAQIAKSAGDTGVSVNHLLAAFATEEGGLMGGLKSAHGITSASWLAAAARLGTGEINTAKPDRVESEKKSAREYLTTEEAAETLGIHVQTIRAYNPQRKAAGIPAGWRACHPSSPRRLGKSSRTHGAWRNKGEMKMPFFIVKRDPAWGDSGSSPERRKPGKVVLRRNDGRGAASPLDPGASACRKPLRRTTISKRHRSSP